MTYEISGNIAYIDGTKGIYNGKIQNPSVAYGRNSQNNYHNYIKNLNYEVVELPDMTGISQLSEDKFEKKMEELDAAIEKMEQQKMPPLHFVQRYMPYSSDYHFIDKDALLGVAYEELGKKTSIKTEEMTKNLQEASNLMFGNDEVKMSAKSLDLNEDGEIDLAEYSTSILLEDALSTDENYNAKNINGTLTDKGETGLLSYTLLDNYAISSAIYKGLYKMYGLDEAQQEFLSEPNNLI